MCLGRPVRPFRSTRSSEKQWGAALNHPCVYVVMPETPARTRSTSGPRSPESRANSFSSERGACPPFLARRSIRSSKRSTASGWLRNSDATVQLSNWQEATRRLAELLPLGPLPANSPKISREDFRSFSFSRSRRRIVFGRGESSGKSGSSRTRVFVPYCGTFPDLVGCVGELPARLPEVRQWLMSLPVDSTELANVLCLGLPFVADADPAFAKLALDPSHVAEPRPQRSRHHRGRADEAAQMVGRASGSATLLNNALLHVLGLLLPTTTSW